MLDSLQIGISEGRQFTQGTPAEWQVYVLVALVAAVALIRLLRPDHFSNMVIGLTSFNLANQMFRRQEQVEWPALALVLNALVVFSMTIANAISESTDAVLYDQGELVLILIATLAALMMIRWFMPLSISAMFGYKQDQKLYDAHVLLAVQMLGLVMLPILVVGVVSKDLTSATVWVALGLTLLGLGYVWTRGLLLARSYLIARPGHFILYFCGLYLAPLLLVLKAASVYLL